MENLCKLWNVLQTACFSALQRHPHVDNVVENVDCFPTFSTDSLKEAPFPSMPIMHCFGGKPKKTGCSRAYARAGPESPILELCKLLYVLKRKVMFHGPYGRRALAL